MILRFSNTYVALEPNNIESSNIRATGDMRRLATAISEDLQRRPPPEPPPSRYQYRWLRPVPAELTSRTLLRSGSFDD
jgi:hypothetical protein